jgi:DNA-binding transcriptional LysR family regulator
MKRPMQLDPEAMLIFATLARIGGIRSAARELNVPRSTLSRKLSELERQVGAPLVVRTARRFVLTEIGVALAQRCEKLEALLDESGKLVRDVSSEPTGTLRVAVAPVLGEEILAPVLAELVARHPRLSIDARLAVSYVDLRRGAVDVALRASTLEDASDLFATRLGTAVSGCYASPAYLAKHKAPTRPSDLAAHDCILVGMGPDQWSFGSGSNEVTIRVGGRLRVDSFRIARDAAACGAGILRVAAVFAEPLVRARMLVPLLERYRRSVPIYAVHAGANPPPPHVRVFIAAVRKAVATALPADGGKPWRSA